GSSLAAALGSWRGPGIAYTVAWQRCDGGGSSCAGLGVSGTTYTPTSADATSTLRAVVTATNRYGSTQAVSDVTAPVAGSAAPPPVAPVSTTLPQISRPVQVGGAVT